MKPIKLTKQTAVKLIRRVCPVPASTIIGPEGDGSAVRFTAPIGSIGLEIVCENDWFDRNGYIKLTISDTCDGGCMVMYFDPETLVRDFREEDRAKTQEIDAARRKWITGLGPKRAHEMVDRYLAEKG